MVTFYFQLFYIIIDTIEQQITENKEINFRKKCPGVSSDLKNFSGLKIAEKNADVIK